jgi:hypothetical protein
MSQEEHGKLLVLFVLVKTVFVPWNQYLPFGGKLPLPDFWPIPEFRRQHDAKWVSG